MSNHDTRIIFTRHINPRAYNLLLAKTGSIGLELTKLRTEDVRELIDQHDLALHTFVHRENLDQVERDVMVQLDEIKPNRLTIYSDNIYVICRPVKDNRNNLTGIEYYMLEAA